MIHSNGAAVFCSVRTSIVAAILFPSKMVRSTLPRPNSIGTRLPTFSCMTKALSLIEFVFTNISLFGLLTDSEMYLGAKHYFRSSIRCRCSYMLF